MIVLTRNTTNRIALTLNEKLITTTGTTAYLFSFVNDLTLVEKNFISVDVSLYPQVNNIFYITESGLTSENLYGDTGTTGTVINLFGSNNSYSYTVYQQDSTTNLLTSYSGITSALEIGDVWVNGTDDNNLNQIYI